MKKAILYGENGFYFPIYLLLQHTILNSALIEEEYQELG